MARTAHHGPSQRQLLSAAVLVLLGFSLLPPRWGGWVATFGDLATTFVGPIKSPVASLARWASPADSRAAVPDEVRELQSEVGRWKTWYYQERARSAELERTIENLAKAKLYTDTAIRPVPAQVIGGSSDPSGGLLEIRAGTNHGVEKNAVVTVDGIQLLGLVERAASRTSWVRLITDGSFGKIGARILIDETTLGPECQLSATGDGRFRGMVAYRSDPQSPEQAPAEIGQEVRLDEPTWPKNARMLLIGRIEAIEPAPDGLLRQIITVRPTVRLERVGEAVVRVVTDPATDPEPATGGTGGGR